MSTYSDGPRDAERAQDIGGDEIEDGAPAGRSSRALRLLPLGGGDAVLILGDSSIVHGSLLLGALSGAVVCNNLGRLFTPGGQLDGIAICRQLSRVDLLLATYQDLEEAGVACVRWDVLFLLTRAPGPPVVRLEGDAAVQIDGLVAVRVRRPDVVDDAIAASSNVVDISAETGVADAAHVSRAKSSSHVGKSDRRDGGNVASAVSHGRVWKTWEEARRSLYRIPYREPRAIASRLLAHTSGLSRHHGLNM